jgi:hypothetical protein
MKLFGQLALAGAIAALALPAAAPAKVFHFKGKATGPKAAPNMVVSFDVTGSKGRATRISNIYVEKAEYNCQLGIKTTERNFRMFSSGTIKRNGKVDVREKQLPPGSDNWFYGQVIYPKTLKNGKRTKLTVKGWATSEFGFGLTRGEYNCLAADQFTATVR